MSHPRIVVLDSYAANPGDLSWSALEALGDVTLYDRTTPRDVLTRAQGADIVIANKARLDRDTLAQLDGLRYIGVLATGVNNVDLEAAAELGIAVTNVPSYSTHSVAQVAFAHLLAHSHAVERHTASVVQEKRWSAGPDWSYTVTPQTEMAGKTLGVVGFGQIGQQIARVALAFGMHVQAYSRNEKTVAGLEAAEWVGFTDVFETSDVLVLACPETPETRGMVNARTLARMKRSALLINVARGGLVVEEDLAAALNRGQLAGAGVDVLASEPPEADSVLLQAKNLTVTPHVAWGTFEARSRLLREAAENLRAFLDGDRRNRVV